MSNSTGSELSSLAGLASAKRVVLELAAGSPVQAILFYGMEGAGKRRLTEILAKSWLCQVSPGPNGSCGECRACLAFDRGRCADILWIEPAGPSRIIKLGAISPVDEDKEYPVSAQLFLRTPPLSARSKVVVIEDADRLNDRAANSLLKTLEEPPVYGRFILLTERVGSILPTILSRSVAVACELEARNLGGEDWAMKLAGGAARRATELQEFGEVYRALYDFGIALGTRPIGEALIASEEFAGLGDTLGAARKMGARAADAEALQILATAYGLGDTKRPAGLLAIAECHRRILGNANAGSAFDAMFCAILGNR